MKKAKKTIEISQFFIVIHALKLLNFQTVWLINSLLKIQGRPEQLQVQGLQANNATNGCEQTTTICQNLTCENLKTYILTQGLKITIKIVYNLPLATCKG